MNPPPAGTESGRRDLRRLALAAIPLGLLAGAVVPFEHLVLRACNANLLVPGRPVWDWLDRSGPRVLQTVAVVLGTVLLGAGAPSADRRRKGIVLLLSLCLALVATTAIKDASGRRRPMADPAHGLALASPSALEDDRSFPSGHVSNATAICAALWLASRRRAARNLVWAVPPAMALSRVCLAVHWPSDVLGGAALGLLAASLAGFVAAAPAADRAVARFGPEGRPLARFAFLAFVWLGITRVWLELPLGRDPVSGAVVPGFAARPDPLRAALEPLFGPPLHLALEDARSLVVPACGWAVALLAGLLAWRRRAARRGAIVLVALLVTWVATFRFGWAPPDRFDAGDRKGVFVDWHLHADDPHDGAISGRDLHLRQLRRGVAWPILTHHQRVADADLRPEYDVAGTEWSGPLPRAGEAWTMNHVLILGERREVEEIYEDDRVDPHGAAARAAQGRQLAVVAHAWRPQLASFESFIDAGVHGFEVGNRRRETDPAALERLRALDRLCRERGLLRFSFSDDHGIPAGSPCVTFLEGVTERDLLAGLSVIASLRAPDRGGIGVIPLLFHPGDPTCFPPRWLAPPVAAFEYFRSLRLPQRGSWLACALLAGLWIFRSNRDTGTARP